jgi:hypothetical protein
LCINSCLIYWRKAGVSFSILASELLRVRGDRFFFAGIPIIAR